MILACNSNISPAEMSSMPPSFHDSFEGEKAPVNDGKNNEKDTCACIGTRGAGLPCIGEKRRGVGIAEDHGHAHRGAGARAGRHGHPIY